MPFYPTLFLSWPSDFITRSFFLKSPENRAQCLLFYFSFKSYAPCSEFIPKLLISLRAAVLVILVLGRMDTLFAAQMLRRNSIPFV
jgi:hypothetical protein